MRLSGELGREPQGKRQRRSRYGSSGQELPAGWLRWYDESTKDCYYENTIDQYCTWNDPTRWWLGRVLDRATKSDHGKAQLGAAENLAGFESIEDAFANWCSEGCRDGFDLEDSVDLPYLSSEVTLHIYDVKFHGAGVLNSIFLPLKLGGAFHTGIQIHGREWSYGASGAGCGIFGCLPKRCHPHKYRESIRLGATATSELDVFNILVKLAPYWGGSTYNVFRKNCNSFCIVLAGALGVDPPPPWIHSLGDGAAELADRARRVLKFAGNRPDPRVLAQVVNKAAVVSDVYGCGRAYFFQTYADAKRQYDSLPYAYASILLVQFGDDDETTWHTAHTYGLQYAVTNIKRHFLGHYQAKSGVEVF